MRPPINHFSFLSKETNHKLKSRDKLHGHHSLFTIVVLHTEVESTQSKRQLCGGSQAAIERMIHFGRELQSMSEHLRRERGKNSANKKMLKVVTPFTVLELQDYKA